MNQDLYRVCWYVQHVLLIFVGPNHVKKVINKSQMVMLHLLTFTHKCTNKNSFAIPADSCLVPPSFNLTSRSGWQTGPSHSIRQVLGDSLISDFWWPSKNHGRLQLYFIIIQYMNVYTMINFNNVQYTCCWRAGNIHLQMIHFSLPCWSHPSSCISKIGSMIGIYDRQMKGLFFWLTK